MIHSSSIDRKNDKGKADTNIPHLMVSDLLATIFYQIILLFNVSGLRPFFA